MSKRILSFLRGMGSVLDIAPEPRKLSARGINKRSTAENLARDWSNVSGDFRRGLESVKKEVDSREKQDA